MKKRIFAMVMAAALCMSMAACSNNKTEEQPTATDSTQAEPDIGDGGGLEIRETVTPVDEGLDVTNIPDGEYAVRLDLSALQEKDGLAVMEAMVYTVTHYDATEIENLQPGQTLYLSWGPTDDESRTVVVETVDVGDGYVKVNGGLDEGGVNFMYDGDGHYRVHLESDATYYQPRGTIMLEIPAEVTFRDSYATPGEEREVAGSDLYNHFSSLEGYEKENFTENCTRVDIKDGKVEGLYRMYIP